MVVYYVFILTSRKINCIKLKENITNSYLEYGYRYFYTLVFSYQTSGKTFSPSRLAETFMMYGIHGFRRRQKHLPAPNVG